MFNQKPINGVFRVPATPKRLSVPQFIEVRDIEGNTVALLSPESDGLKNCWIDDEQNGSCTLEFELPLDNPKWQYLTDRYRIYAGGKEFVILNPDAVDKQRDGKKLKGKVKAHESWVLLGKKYQTICNDPLIGTPPWGAVIIVSGGTAHGGFDPGSAGSALSYLLQGTGWTVGTVDVTGTYDLETEKESVLYNINQVQEKWGGILIWDSINKTVSLRDEATYKPYTGFQIRYAKNLKGITRTDDYDIVTRLYPFGENDLNIANVNGGLLYLDNHSYSDDILEGVWYNQDIADQTQLKIAGEKQLAVMCRPRHNYKTEVLDLRSLPGYGHETFNRSDMVDLIDEDLGIDTQVRIIRYRYNVFQPWLCDMELGDPLEKIQATVAQTVLMAKFYKNVVAPNTSFQNLLKAIINTAATEINGASGDYTLVDGVSTWFDRDPETGELTGKLLRITPQGLIISHDGGQTWKLAISGEGIHADAGWVGKLNAGVVTIGPETTFAPGYDPVDNHVYFQYSADGTTNWHDTFNPASDKYMRQKVGDNGTWSDPMRVVGEDGKDGYTPIKGVDYFDGVDGQDGTSAYLWVRYSQNANGNPMTTDPTGAVYIGIATTTTPTAPTSHTAYQWSLIKGQDGVPGEKGADGKTSYLHIKYSDDGVTFTANNGETPGAYIGTYVDFNPVDSTNFSDYTWNKVKGEDGQDVRKFTSQPTPPYDVGDLWIGGSDGKNTQICVRARASGSFVASDFSPITETPASMGVDSDCVGLWHFDGSLNSHKGVAADSNADYNTGLFGQALNIATGKHLKVPAAGLSASQGTINFRAKNLAESGNGSVLVDLQGIRAGIASDGRVYIRDAGDTAYGPNKSTLTGWDSISLAWKPDRLSLVVNDEEACYIENPGLPASLGSHIFIGTDRNGANAINTLVDELRIDKVYREVNIRTGWHKTGIPFYTSEDMKQWPGYMKLETDGLKVYDSSDDLRVLVGSWLKDAVRKYGIKIIDGEIYSSLISTGPEGDDRGAVKIRYNNYPSHPFFNWGVIEFYGGSGKKLIELGVSMGQQPSLQFYDETSTDPYYLPAGYLYLATAGSTKEIALFANDRGLSISTLNEYITLGSTAGVQGQRGIGITGFRSDLNPIEDGWANLGQPNRRWWAGYIFYTQTGDLCFSEQTCAICGGRFESGDVLALLTEAILEDGYTYTIPVHEKCKDIEKTIEVKVPEMTTKYRVNDQGEVVPYKTALFEEVEEEILRVHPDYELDENTGKFKRKLNDWNRQFYSEDELLNGVYSSERGAKVRDTVIRKKPKFRTLSIQVGKPPE